MPGQQDLLQGTLDVLVLKALVWDHNMATPWRE